MTEQDDLSPEDLRAPMAQEAVSDRRGRGPDRRVQNIPVAVERRVGERRGGRPRRDDARRQKVRIRLSDDEILKLRRVAAVHGQTAAGFMRDAISIAIEDACDDESPLRADSPYTPRKGRADDAEHE